MECACEVKTITHRMFMECATGIIIKVKTFTDRMFMECACEIIIKVKTTLRFLQ